MPEVLLAISIIKVQKYDGTFVNMRALIDQGSQTSLITENAAQVLGQPRSRCQGVISGVGAKESNYMPRKYVRKAGARPRATWTEDALIEAFEELRQNKYGKHPVLDFENEKRLVAHIQKLEIAGFPVTRDTVQRLAFQFAEKLGEHPTLDFDNEKRLVAHIQKLEKAGFPTTRQDVRRLAFEFAEKLGLENSFKKETRMAGQHWLKSFLERHPELSIRQAEGLSIARAQGLNRDEVNKMFELLLKVLTENEARRELKEMEEEAKEMTSRRNLNENEIQDILLEGEDGDDLVLGEASEDEQDEIIEDIRLEEDVEIVPPNVNPEENDFVPSSTRPSFIRDTSITELKALFGLFYLAGVPKINHLTVKEIFDNTDRCTYLKNLAFDLIKPHLEERFMYRTLPTSLQLSIGDILGKQRPIATETSSTPKSGRCYFCLRSKDRKSRVQCTKCKLFICNDHQSKICQNCLTIKVSQVHLRRVSFVNPDYGLPSRKTLSEKNIPEEYHAACSAVVNMLHSEEYVAATTDMWTSDSNKAYLTVTIHFIYNSKLISQTISTTEVMEEHSSIILSNVLKSTFDE
ncbi:unnamed protein product, partial [Brenthis ino]